MSERQSAPVSRITAVNRRLLLRSGLSLGALSLLSGCNLADGDASDRLLWAMSRFNDRIQALLFSRTRLAPIYPTSSLTKPFRQKTRKNKTN